MKLGAEHTRKELAQGGGILCACGFAALLVVGVPATSQARDNSWDSTAGGNWEGVRNWSAGTAPTNVYSGIVITNQMPKTVTISSNTAISFPGTMIISNLTLSSMGGGGMTNQLLLSTGGSARPLEVLDGVRLDAGGRMEVDNSALQIDSSAGGSFLIGGTLVVRNGGQITAACQQMAVSNGAFLANELDVSLDSGSQGTLTVADGTITLSSLLDIGVSTAASGTVWLKGGQVWVTNGCTYIGDSGVGCMTVSNGTFLAGEVRVGFGSGSQGTLTIAGGSLNVLSNMVVGNPPCSSLAAITMSGGTLSVTNGAKTAILEVCNGTFTLTGGRLVVDQLVITNSCGHFLSTGGTLTVGSVVLDPSMSAVGDGIPNGWKLQYRLNPFDANLGNEDSDGDGLSNLQEYLAGTDPNNSASALRITAIVPVGADIRVYFTSASGKYYYLERRVFLRRGWANIIQNIPGNGGIQWVKDIGGAARSSAFYHVGLAQLSSPPPVDSDADGIPDWWTQEYFGHLTGQAAGHSLASDDADGDGLSNLQEYLAGTDPTNSASALRITAITRSGNDIRISWTAVTNKTYVVQVVTNFTSGAFANAIAELATVVVPASPAITATNYLDIGAVTNGPSRVYRIRLIP